MILSIFFYIFRTNIFKIIFFFFVLHWSNFITPKINIIVNITIPIIILVTIYQLVIQKYWELNLLSNSIIPSSWYERNIAFSKSCSICFIDSSLFQLVSLIPIKLFIYISNAFELNDNLKSLNIYFLKKYFVVIMFFIDKILNCC